jgi:hypothetical protein
VRSKFVFGDASFIIERDGEFLANLPEQGKMKVTVYVPTTCVSKQRHAGLLETVNRGVAKCLFAGSQPIQ